MRMNRRCFLRTAGAAAVAIPFTGFPAVVKRRNANELLSHASIGVGGMGFADLSELKPHHAINITAICDVDSNSLERAKKLCPDARIYRDAFEMFAAEGDRIDSVNVATPDHTHAQYILQALKRGQNVYAQKPICHDIVDCQRIFDAARQSKAVTQMGTQIAAWECDRTTVAAIRSGTIGEIRKVWLFSTRRDDPGADYYRWPLEPAPVPKTLEWKIWLGPAKFRPYVPKVYHPGQWRRWRDFGSSWLGDLGLHLMSPVWIGMDLGVSRPISIRAEISDDGFNEDQRREFWPGNSHIVWEMPGVKASGGKPFVVEWCDGFESARFRMEPRFMPPAFLQDIAAQTPAGRLPLEGRVIEGEKGWILSTHVFAGPYYVMKDGRRPPPLPLAGAKCNHRFEYIDCCIGGGRPASSFDWTLAMNEMMLLGNDAMLRPNENLTTGSKVNA